MTFHFYELFLPTEGETTLEFTRIPSARCNFQRFMDGRAAFQRLSSNQVQGLEKKVIYLPRLADIAKLEDSDGKGKDFHLLRIIDIPSVTDIWEIKKEIENPTYLISEKGLWLLDALKLKIFYSFKREEVVSLLNLLDQSTPLKINQKRKATIKDLQYLRSFIKDESITLYSEEEKALASKHLQWLTAQGFNIHRYSDDIPPDPQALAKELKIEVDSIALIPKEEFMPFILYLFDNIEVFKPFTHIDLDHASLSLENLKKLIKEQGKKIKSLNLGSYSIEKLSPIELKELTSLESLSIHSYIPAGVSSLLKLDRLKKLNLSYSDSSSDTTASLLKQIKSLEVLDLHNNQSCQYVDFSKISLTELRDLNLSGLSFFTMKKINAILTQTKKLEYLKLNDFYFDSFPSLLVLQNLRKLSLNNNSNLTPHHLAALLCHAINLEELDLSYCNDLNGENFPLESSFPLKRLKKLKASNSLLSINILKSILFHASELEELDIHSTQFFPLPETEFPCLSLKKLKKFNASESEINTNILAGILYEAFQLRELKLKACKALLIGTLPFPLPLINLKILDASLSCLNSKSLEYLLIQAIKLKHLNISGCEELQEAILTSLPLKNLEGFWASKNSLNTRSLESIISQAEHLDILDLSECRELKETLSRCLKLCNLTSLFLSKSNLNSPSLGALIADARRLETLDLDFCDNLQEELNSSPPLENLSRLDSQGSNLGTRSLEKLATYARGLKNLNIASCSNIKEAFSTPLNLENLTDFNASSTCLSTKDLKLILGSGSSLDMLRLDSCPNIKNLPHSWLKKLKKSPGKISQVTENLGALTLTQDFQAFSHTDSSDEEPLDSLSLSGKKSYPQASFLNKAISPSKKAKAQDKRTQAPCSIDANTAPTPTTFDLKRQIIGRPYTPHPTTLRLKIYDRLELNLEDPHHPFLLFPKALPEREAKGQSIFESLSPLNLRFKAEALDEKTNLYLGEFEIEVGEDWVLLPGVHSEEEMLAWHGSSRVNLGASQVGPRPNLLNLEVKKIGAHHYIRYGRLGLGPINHSIPCNEMDPSSNRGEKVHLQVLLKAPIASTDLSFLPDEIKKLVHHCRGFRNHALKKDLKNLSPEEQLKALTEERVGSCRHRVIAFMYLLETKLSFELFSQLEVEILANEAHIFPRIKYQGRWIDCDLGGYEAKLHIKEQSFSRQEFGNMIDPPLKAEELAQVSYSRQGRQREASFFTAAKNLSTLTLNETLDLPEELDLNQINTLNLLNCEFSAQELNDLLKKLPNLQTLKIKYAKIKPETFKAIDLSCLHHLDWVELIGDFIPDRKALDALIQTHPKHENIRWIIESSNLKPESKASEIEITRPNRGPLPKRYSTDKGLPSLSEIIENRQNALLNTPYPIDAAYEIQRLLREKEKPYFFISEASQLQLNRPFINKEGLIEEGPGGELYQWLNENPEGSLIIDYSRFKARDMVGFNSLFNEKDPHIDGEALKKQNIIGLIDPKDPRSYKGADFTSRLKPQIDFTPPRLSSLKDNYISKKSPGDFPIDLSGFDSVNTLKGYWVMGKNKRLNFKAGVLAKALSAAPKRIVLKNPPINDPEFIHFFRTWELEHPQGPRLVFEKDLNFSTFNEFFTWSDEPELPFSAIVLNSATLSQCIGEYDLIDEILVEKEGLIKKLPSPVHLHITSSLSSLEWINLLTFAKNEKKKLILHAAPGLTLPQGLPKPEVLREKQRELIHPHTQYLVGDISSTIDSLSSPLASASSDTKEVKTMIIEVSELEENDLFASLHGWHEKGNPYFSLEKKPSFLEDKLKDGSTIVLKGQWPKNLKQSLEGFLSKRLEDPKAKGKLILQSDTQETFSSLIPNQEAPCKSIDPPTAKSLAFEERYHAVKESLNHFPLLLISGETGVGKTQFINKVWKKEHPLCFFGENSIEEWAKTEAKEGDYVTLILDEANLSHHQWSEFFGLLNESPALFSARLKERYKNLSPRHRVIFLGNPPAYGGERKTPLLFEQIPNLTFEPIPLKLAIEPLELPETIKEVLLAVFEKLADNYPNKLIITPREAVMMGLMSRLLSQKEPALDSKTLTQHVAYQFLKSHLHENDRELFKSSLETICNSLATSSSTPPTRRDSFAASSSMDPRVMPLRQSVGREEGVSSSPPICDNSLATSSPTSPTCRDSFAASSSMNPAITLKGFTLTPSMEPALEALSWHLVLRQARQEGNIQDPGGLGGLVLEGPPGIGKSTLLVKALEAHGLKEAKDFVHIPVSWDSKKKEAALLSAFHQGCIVIIDEINSSPMMEKLLNALLEGHDLENNPAKNPGFLLLGTQNPITFSGRKKTTLPLLHRFQHLYLEDYTSAELHKILIDEYKLSAKIAFDMEEEYQREKRENPELCCRDLFDWAKSWKKKYPEPIEITIKFRQKQVGATCKLTALASLDSYYAEKLHYPFLPLHKEKSHPSSIRKLAKNSGSLQGEILEFSRWEETLKNLGYATKTIDFECDFNSFLQAIVKNLKKGNLPLIAFALNMATGQPDPFPENPEEREHASLITGYDPYTDQFTLTHWGEVYKVDALTLFNANQALVKTRTSEYYMKNSRYKANPEEPKYLACPEEILEKKVSITPKTNTGFRSKLLIAKKPEEDQLHSFFKRREPGDNEPYRNKQSSKASIEIKDNPTSIKLS